MTGVLQVLPRLQSGGAERTTLEIAQALAAAGERALVASAGGRLVEALKALGARHVALPLDRKDPWTLWRNHGLLKDLCRREQIDIVHARSRAPAWSALWAARALGLGFVTTWHGDYAAKTPTKRLYNSVMARGDCVIANSHYTAAQIQSVAPQAADRIVVIPRGVDLTLFDPDAIAPERVAGLFHGLELNDWRRPVPLFVLPARFTHWKGHLLTLEAVRRMRAANAPDFQAILVGDDQRNGEVKASVTREIAASCLAAVVKTAPHVADMPALYALADVVLSPSTAPEAFGRVAIEAQAMRRPILASDFGGARETVRHGETGFLVRPHDANALAEAMAQILQAPAAERARIGGAGRALVAERFSLAHLQQATLRVYQQVRQDRKKSDYGQIADRHWEP